MTRRRPLALAAVAAATLAPAASAQLPQPTLAFDRGCYTEDQRMVFSGTGYSPGGRVDLWFNRVGAVLGTYETTADAGGAIGDFVTADAEQMLRDDEDRETRYVSANDRTRMDQGSSPEAQFAAASFTFTRWMGFSPGRYVPGRKAAVEIYGWAFAEGKAAYFLFRKGRRTVASVKLGTIAGPCGDLKARVKVPRALRAGRYELWLSTDRKRPSERSTWREGRVVKRAWASASAAGAMARR